MKLLKENEDLSEPTTTSAPDAVKQCRLCNVNLHQAIDGGTK